MASIKSSDLVSFVIDARKSGWGYVFGGQGQLYTEELAEKWGRRRRSGRDYSYFVNRCARWFGKIVVDCSGLIIEAYRSRIPGYGDKTANTLFGRCVQTGMLDSIPEIPGLCVWRSGHIGIYIGNGKVVEAGGTNIGVVTTKLNAPATNKRWTNWGRLADVNYEGASAPPDEPETPSCWVGRYLEITHPYTKGEDVEEVQQALADQGFSTGPIDGIYGPLTAEAVKRFQQSKGLAVDGIVGPNTTKELLGSWVTDCDGKPYPPGWESPLDAFELNRILKLTTPFMSGDDVREVQDALKEASSSPGESDGIYGPRTESAVEEFQRSRGLQVDGIVGPNTCSELGGLWRGN
jgi:peptidoglycan hydrolase-like protein with peptidoglycan-binding domain